MAFSPCSHSSYRSIGEISPHSFPSSNISANPTFSGWRSISEASFSSAFRDHPVSLETPSLSIFEIMRDMSLDVPTTPRKYSVAGGLNFCVGACGGWWVGGSKVYISVY